MSTYFTLLTTIGAAAVINAQASGTTVELTHLALGDGNGAAIVPTEAMTALKREVHRVPLSSITIDPENPTWLIVEAVVPTQVGGWTVREIGLIGGPGARLLAVGNFPETYKPMLTEGSGRDLVVRMILQVGNAALVQLTVDPSVSVATHQALKNAIAAHEAKSDPHPQYLRKVQRGAPDGVASLDSTGLVPPSQLPPAIATDEELAASLYAHVDPAQDPHSQYLTVARMNALLRASRAARYFFANF